MPVEELQVLIKKHDPVILVNRAAILVYRDHIAKVLYSELEKAGPVKFDVTKLRRWLHPKETKCVVNGNEIYESLKNNNLLAGCLGLAELQAIRERGPAFFRKYFSGSPVIAGWRSVVAGHQGELYVPYLNDGCADETLIPWCGIDCFGSPLTLLFT